MATKIDTFKWVAATGRTRILKAWQLTNSKKYKAVLSDTGSGKIKELDFYDYWDFIDWLSSLEFKFVSRLTLNCDADTYTLCTRREMLQEILDGERLLS